MAYVISTTAGPDRKFESYDLDQLPLLDGREPRLLAQEGKLSSHQLFDLLKQRKIPGISNSDGVQTLLLAWARHLKKQQDEEKIALGIKS